MAYSKQNFQNGQILNAANLEAMENGIIAGQGAHNLLDNSDFTNPVNQRGKTSYSGGEYAIDRWKMQSGTNMTLMDGFIRITGSWDAQQILGNKLIGTYTYAIYAKVNVAGEYTQTIEIYENGSSIATSFCTTVGEWKIFTCTATFTGGTNPVVTINNRAGSVSDASMDVQWAALYEGSYTAETLPPYVPKGKHVEMLNCGVPLTPHNLLDNSDFRNPVNQRGIESGTTVSAWKYHIDRWNNYHDADGTISFNTNGIVVNMHMGQVLNPDSVKTGTVVTAAVKWNDGTIQIARGTITRGNAWTWFYSGTQNGSLVGVIDNGDNRTSIFVVQSDGRKTLVWAALYEGAYDASTLPAYVPKGYAAELAECQRYYRPFINAAPAMSIAATAIEAEMALEPPMRVVPTITINSVGSAYTPEGVKSVSGSYASTNTVNKAGYVFYTPSIGIGLSCVITGIDGYLSADL